MTSIERQVWAATFGARYATSDIYDTLAREGDAFEVATNAVVALREMARDGGPFGDGLGDESAIEAEILAEVQK